MSLDDATLTAVETRFAANRVAAERDDYRVTISRTPICKKGIESLDARALQYLDMNFNDVLEMKHHKRDKHGNIITFRVHRATLLRVSDVLAERVIRQPAQAILPHVGLSTAKMFLAWAYNPQTPIVIDCNKGQMFVRNVVEAYTFGQQVQALVFCNTLLDGLYDNQINRFADLTMDHLVHICDYTEPGSKLRLLALDIAFRSGWFDRDVANVLGDGDHQISQNDLNACKARHQSKQLAYLNVEDLCERYHVHSARQSPAQIAAAIEAGVEEEDIIADGSDRDGNNGGDGDSDYVE